MEAKIVTQMRQVTRLQMTLLGMVPIVRAQVPNSRELGVKITYGDWYPPLGCRIKKR
ncbi:hypothetical protein TNCV_1239131 [Trichonephila clavipes]|nr:hypothetical protein TNCV_1239131 [Trichonephila clavipes]